VQEIRYPAVAALPQEMAAWLSMGQRLVHPGMVETWRENRNNPSMQITFMKNGTVEIDIDPNNPMFNFPAHSVDVIWDWLASTDTNYSTVANQFGFNVPHCP